LVPSVTLDGENPLRDDEVQAVFGPCHTDMQPPQIFLDRARAASAKIGGNAASDNVQDEDGLTFLTLVRVH
jgi:hypothetical protein